MESYINFYDEETNEEVALEIIDAMDLDGQRYVLVANEDEEAFILKEVQMNDTEITYEVIEDDEEFQKITLLFMENEGEYSIEL